MEKSDNRVENNLREIAEELKKLETISYDNLVDLLVDESCYYQISLYDNHEILNDVHYICVKIMKNYNTDGIVTYLTEDQDLDIAYTKLMEALKRKGAESYIQVYYDYNFNYAMSCIVGSNDINLPKPIVRKLLDNQVDIKERRENDILCLFSDKEVFVPRALTNIQTKKR